MQWSRLDDYRTVSPPRPNSSRSRGGPLNSANASTAVYGATYHGGSNDTTTGGSPYSQRRAHVSEPRGGGGYRAPMDFGVHHAPSGGAGPMPLYHNNNNNNQHQYSSHNSSYIYEGAQPRPPSALQLQQLPQYLQATTTMEMDVYHHQPSPPPPPHHNPSGAGTGSPLSVHHHYYTGGGGAMNSSVGQYVAPAAQSPPPSVHHHYQPAPGVNTSISGSYHQSSHNQSHQGESSPYRNGGGGGGVSVHHHYSPPSTNTTTVAQQNASNYYRSSVQNSGYLMAGGGGNGSRDAFLPPHIVQGRHNTNSHVMRSLGLMQGELLNAHVRAALLRVEDDEREFRQCIWSDYDRNWEALFDRSKALNRRAIDEGVAYREEQLILEQRRRLLLEDEERKRRHAQDLLEDEEKKRRRAQDLLAEHDRRVRRGEAVRQQVIGEIESDRSQVVFERKVHQMEVSTGGHRGVVEVPYEFEMYQSFVKESDEEALARRQRNEARKQQALEAARTAAAAKVRAQTMGGRNPDQQQDATILQRSATSPTQRGARRGHLDYRPSPTRSREGGRTSPGGISSASSTSRLRPSRQYLPSLSATSPIPHNTSPGMRSNSSEMSAARRRRSAERSDVRVATTPLRGSSPYQDRSPRKSVRFYEQSLSEAQVGGGRVSPVRTTRLPTTYQAPPPLQPLNTSRQFEGTHKSPDKRRAKSAFMTSVLSL